MSRSVRDTARWFDVCNGYDARDPFSLPRDRGLGSRDSARTPSRCAACAPRCVADWGGAVVSPAMWEVLEEAATHLIALAGLRRVDGVDTSLPDMGAAWGLSGGINIEAQLKEYWPECADVLTPEMRHTMENVPGRYDSEQRARIEARRMELNERMAEIFHPTTGVDFVFTATNPDVAFEADGPLPAVFGGVKAGRGNNGKLTFAANLHGNAAISIPAGTVDGLPVGLQAVGRHYSEELLLDLALAMERSRPWSLVAAPALRV